MSKETVGVILAGGKSRRMGTDKAFLEIGGVPLITRVIDVLLPIFPTVVIVSKESKKFSSIKGVQLIQDLFPEQHALGGIYTALSTFPGRDCFVFSCDLPFLNPSLIHFMMQQRNGYDVFLPRSRHGLEPLHALYTEKCLNLMGEQIRQKRWNLESLIHKVHCRILNPDILHTFDPEEFSFLNVNTPEEFKKAEAIKNSQRSYSLDPSQKGDP